MFHTNNNNQFLTGEKMYAKDNNASSLQHKMTPVNRNNEIKITTLSELSEVASYAAEGFGIMRKQNSFISAEKTNKSYVFLAMMMAKEIGLKPIQGLLNISIINGRPTLWGDAMLALVRKSGLLDSFKETFVGKEFEDSFHAKCVLKRKSYSIIEYKFSVSDAKKAILWRTGEGKTPWHKYPKRMLQMRARSWALRDTFADILMGFSTTEEEMDVYQDYSNLKNTNDECLIEKKEVPETENNNKGLIEITRKAIQSNPKLGAITHEVVEKYITVISEQTEEDKGSIIRAALKNIDEFSSYLQKYLSKRMAVVKEDTNA